MESRFARKTIQQSLGQGNHAMNSSVAAIAIVFAFSTTSCAATCNSGSVAQHFDSGVHVEGPRSVEVVERREMATLEMDGQTTSVPFGRQSAEWEALKSRLEAGDCLYFYSASSETWELRGRQGYIVIRDDRPHDGLVTKRN
jgi:hypothetical protein